MDRTGDNSHSPVNVAVGAAQYRVSKWIISRFGASAMDRRERAARILEEALELTQAEGIGRDDVYRLAMHVYSKPVGKPDQEVAGIGVCLLGWAESANVNMWNLIMQELERIEGKSVEHFRARHKIKSDAGIAMKAEEPEDG